MPHWLIGWDVFAFIGHRRFARNWSVPQIQRELVDTHQIFISHDTIENHIAYYQTMVAARHQDFKHLSQAYQKISEVILSIDGLQPEKGHETLYVVREINAKRVWFAEPLLSNTASEIEKLIRRAKEIAKTLGLSVRLWVSDKQDAILKAIKRVFPKVPHKYCENHFLRDLAKPVMEADSAAKVKMRKKVRGLRGTEQKMTQPSTTAEKTADDLRYEDEQKEVVLDYCSALRGILSDDQGGPIDLPGLRMAEAVSEIRDSLTRCLKMEVGGKGEEGVKDLIAVIDTGLNAVQEEQKVLREYVKDIQAVKETLDLETGNVKERKKRFQKLYRHLSAYEDDIHQHIAGVMDRFSKGLFVTGDDPDLPSDNQDLERFFKVCKSHERKIHGRQHTGMRLVVEGPTVIPTLDAHLLHPSQFSCTDLFPYSEMDVPPAQKAALARKKKARLARSRKKRRRFCENLESRYGRNCTNRRGIMSNLSCIFRQFSTKMPNVGQHQHLPMTC
ncbi:MAG: hypothetical protein Q8O23_03260 [Gallionella sp.]|nr:hypothetical protein [Gallionella sp.]